ncbi:MAG: transcription elongation factor GreA [Gammaproteobacteria bacterium RIFCSPLOWO2_01_FULL_47_190]|jgi:transcription elongation factor GreA|nr:MAG: transcription elongation factor GreA [Gammaproteobacteria bacterium RIFCSPLOWO2_01_FULL_47_190]OGT72881.1 MAG: transcription elongation factor GreA [Gammaproteobacteria bacterium RIFCSPLOWO2_12_47_11]OGT86915.1 MAG: transcription elongation factor GreA [Gammaproteobacteria bacterium RIFCSPLOWO2_12_FULL_47_76]
MSKPPITARGAQRLREQLKELKTVDRPRITRAIAEARAHGDLSENAEYHAAREQQSFLEGRIAAIETALADAQIIDVTSLNTDGKVVFGATIGLMNLANDEEVTYQIVGEMEADIEKMLISISSPIARALIGKLEGDVVEVKAPGGTVEYEILEVRYE